MESIVGFAVFLIILLGVRALVRAIFRSPRGIQIRVRDVMEINPETGGRYPAFAVDVRGSVSVPHDQCPVEFRLHLFDGEGGDLFPVLSMFDGLQEVDTFAFEWRGDPTPIPLYNRVVEWTTMVSVPKEILVFPKKGARRLNFQLCAISPTNPPQFQLGFTDGTTGVGYDIAHASRPYNNTEPGYEEADANRRVTVQLTTELALHLAAVDNDLSAPETAVVKDWMKKALSMVPEESRKEEKEIFVEATRASYANAKDGKSDLIDIIGRMNEVAAKHEKYEALELCMDVMAADGRVDPEEMKEIDRIATLLQLDPKTYRELREQRLARVGDVSGISENLTAMLGITANMRPEDIQKHLINEYRKWNSRVNHPDEKIRKRAEEMLLLIGEVRAKYVD
ncbi:MAG: tellurite resistance TerB family protein [Planctomycetota bacterium]|jgi:tellurite resistance protein